VSTCHWTPLLRRPRTYEGRSRGRGRTRDSERRNRVMRLVPLLGSLSPAKRALAGAVNGVRGRAATVLTPCCPEGIPNLAVVGRVRVGKKGEFRFVTCRVRFSVTFVLLLLLLLLLLFTCIRNRGRRGGPPRGGGLA
jgi:hypothetical protein